MEYLSTITDKVNYLFTYNVLYSKSIQKKFKYHVEGILKIYSPDSKSEILYEKKYLFLDNKSYSNKEMCLQFLILQRFLIEILIN